MARSNQSSIEGYIRSQRDKGFSEKEIVDRMKKAGYDEEVISIATKCHRQRRWMIALSLACLILVIVAVFMYARTPQLVSYGVPPRIDVAQPVAQKEASCPLIRAEPVMCLEIPVDRRAECLKNALTSLDNAYKYRRTPGTADYFEYSQIISVTAALMDDESVCERLSGSEIARCLDYIPFLRATMGKEVASCDRYGDDNKFLNCYTEALRYNDPAGAKEFAARFGEATRSARETGDLESCRILSAPRLVAACMDYVHYSFAILKKDMDRCSKIEDGSYQDFCRTEVLRLMTPSPLPVGLAGAVMDDDSRMR